MCGFSFSPLTKGEHWGHVVTSEWLAPRASLTSQCAAPAPNVLDRLALDPVRCFTEKGNALLSL